MEKLVILDDFPFWTTFLLAIMVVVGFLLVLTMLIRSLQASRRDVRVAGAQARSGRQSWLFVTAGTLALWFWAPQCICGFTPWRSNLKV